MADETGTGVKHIVVFRFHRGASADAIGQVVKAFRALPDRIPGIVAFDWGVNNSPEGRNRGYTHVFQLVFDSAASRDAYLPHPEHRRFGELLEGLGVLDEAFVVDYTPQ